MLGELFRKGITIIELFDKFPDGEFARKWFEKPRWPDGIGDCTHCESVNTRAVELDEGKDGRFD